MKMLILKHFEIRWNKWCPNQVLRKLVKHHNLVNVNSRESLYLQRAPFGVFFYFSLLLMVSLMWYNEVRTVPHFRRVYGVQGEPIWIVKELVSITRIGRFLVVYLILIT